MTLPKNWSSSLCALMLAALLTACGGGGDSSDSSASNINNQSSGSGDFSAPNDGQQESGAPALTGDTAQDGFNWTNYRREQAGIPVLTRSSIVNIAAKGHSDYQVLNNTITHEQIRGNPGFTGVQLQDRLRAAGYSFDAGGIAGEVIAAANDNSGHFLAEELITAIYHRFVLFEPAFKESGTGAATTSNGRTYFTNNLTANGFGPGLGIGQIAVYPFVNQVNVSAIFFSDQEQPDPAPDRNEVGYPISVHADFGADLLVTSFTVRPRGGANMSVRLLTKTTDPQTKLSGPSAAAIIPLAVLAINTTYDVEFVGSVNGVPANKNWSFTTRNR
ncbi:MAG: hypothetical protein ACI83P_000966 [Janthinobacterium sp.]|jgi:uncharacterized protein YkwD